MGRRGQVLHLPLFEKQLGDGERAPDSESSVAEMNPVLRYQLCALSVAPVLPQLPPLKMGLVLPPPSRGCCPQGSGKMTKVTVPGDTHCPWHAQRSHLLLRLDLQVLPLRRPDSPEPRVV